MFEKSQIKVCRTTFKMDWIHTSNNSVNTPLSKLVVFFYLFVFNFCVSMNSESKTNYISFFCSYSFENHSTRSFYPCFFSQPLVFCQISVVIWLRPPKRVSLKFMVQEILYTCIDKCCKSALRPTTVCFFFDICFFAHKQFSSLNDPHMCGSVTGSCRTIYTLHQRLCPKTEAKMPVGGRTVCPHELVKLDCEAINK